MSCYVRSALLIPLLCSLHACQSSPLLPAEPAAMAPTHEKGELVLAPAWGRRVAEVGLYSRYSIDHLTLKLFKVSGATETLVTSLDVAQADLDLPVKFSDLLANTTYRVRAYAYKAAGSAPSDLISTDDDRSMVEVVVASGNPTIAALKVRLVDRYWAKVSTLTGNGTELSVDGALSDARLLQPYGLAIDSAGVIYFSEVTTGKIRRIKDGQVELFASAAAGVSFSSPYNLAVDAGNNVLVADSNRHRIVKITPAGVASVLAGSGTAGRNNGVGTAAQFDTPQGVAVDGAGNVYVADSGNSLIRKIASDRTVSTVAGGSDGFANNADPLSARFSFPTAVAVGPGGVIYVADSMNCLIRKISSQGVSTLAGALEAFDSVDGTGTAAKFNFPSGLTLDRGGNLYVADSVGNRIRKVTPEGVVTTVGGTGAPIPFTENPATNAVQNLVTFNYPVGLAFDAQGALYVGDSANHRIRKIQ